jgi:hypothetical protein
VTNTEENIQEAMDNLNPFAEEASQIGQIPFFNTGARALIKMGGKAIAVAQDIRWQVSYVATPINTIDSAHAWDIDIGAATVNASLTRIVDPTKGPEVDFLFHTMRSSVHQPLVEIQVLDRGLDTSLFFARGMFTQVSGNIARGAMSTFSAHFTGIAYQHYVAQAFQPYESIAGSASAAVDGLQNLASDFSGGLF